MMSLTLLVIITNNYAEALDDLIKSQDVVVKKHTGELKDFIDLANKNVNKYQQHAKSIIQHSMNNSNINSENEHLDWLNNLNLKEAQNSCLASNLSSNSELYIFASLSMPKTRLIELIKEAIHYNGMVVLRGLKNNSYKETTNLLQPIIKDAGAGFIIDPTLFSKFNITQVPVFILNDTIENKHDKVSGNINLKYALEQFAKDGDLKQEASKILSMQQ